MFDQVFLSPQVKRIVIIGNKHGIYKLPHELPNNLTLRIIDNSEILGKYQQNYSIVLSLSPKMIFFSILVNCTLPVVPYFTLKILFVSNIFCIILVFRGDNKILMQPL